MDKSIYNDLPSATKSLRINISELLSESWLSVPSFPGVYIFEDENKKPLYIGKSINLRSRIRQHYQGYKDGSTKASQFIPQTKTVYFRILNNDVEAIIVEANYIKTYQPRYNSISKDNKSNVYIIFTNKPDTKLRIIHATDLNDLNLDNYKNQIYGPYTSSSIAQVLLKQVRNIFGYCLSPMNPRSRACFNYHIEHCPGICQFQISEKDYQKHLGKIKKFLSGKFKLLSKQLGNTIKKQIKSQSFEAAEITKKQIDSLNRTLESRNSSLLLKLSDASEQIQKVIVTTLNHPKLQHPPQRIECYDLAHLQGTNYVGSMTVFINGLPNTAEYRHFNILNNTGGDPGAMKHIIERRFNHNEWQKPDLIVLDGGIPQLSIVSPSIPDSIPVIALAKSHETILFYDQSGKVVELNLNIEDPVLNTFRHIRDEAHRFANSFHKKKRTDNLLT